MSSENTQNAQQNYDYLLPSATHCAAGFAHIDVQRKATHTPRFYQPIETLKLPIQGSAWEVIYNHLAYGFAIDRAYIELGIAVIWVRKDDIVGVLAKLKSLGYEVLSEMSAVDMLAKDNRFEMFYQLHSVQEGFSDKRRVRVKCYLGENEQIDSVSSIFSLALWSEREAYDMLGIRFVNHPNLTRLLMPKDWVGHPLRRSYPLQGDEYAAWYEIDKIFGKEYREVVGAEQRDSARVDPNDGRSFSKLDAIGEEGDGLYMDASKALFVKDIARAKKTRLERRK
ncbi:MULTISPECIES: NADH-quinone oxidoreductase subunit C [Helicobacter]|uniref:NADH-quinone oxidoreductase subunit C n=2 Tax=Helicobacter TaxID=209 RepID=A0A5M9QIJ5_9HELI|nr:MULTISPECIES: NADH-quinone oxidoreductase subunit C [Helicobacter]KAA8707879.1 NADH-quinone oxidoreductase subunit C [Helicobacter canis]MDL0080237.1 NADH-quinone oxidoreductase subunit C [Helicobacter sp. CPD2-1]MDL0082298.1 NADH-quinone oxidoreductase subunit C [Helicobacter sp. XJK30-2]